MKVSKTSKSKYLTPTHRNPTQRKEKEERPSLRSYDAKGAKAFSTSVLQEIYLKEKLFPLDREKRNGSSDA